MSHLKPLRDELFKYRKRRKRAMDGRVPGLPSPHYHRFTTAPLGSRRSDSGRYHHESYLGQIPSEYRPSLFAPAVDWSEYQQEQGGFTPIPRTPQSSHPSQSWLPENPMPVASSDELSVTEQFLMNMGVRPRPQEGPVPVEPDEIRHLMDGVSASLHTLDGSLETNCEEAIAFPEGIPGRLHPPQQEHHLRLPDLDDVTQALEILQDCLPADHPDLINLQQAQRQLNPQQEEGMADSWQSNLGSGNPYEHDDLIEVPLQEPLEEPTDLACVQGVQEVLRADPPVLEEMVPEPILEDIVEQELKPLPFEAQEMAMPLAEIPIPGGGLESMDAIATAPLDRSASPMESAMDEINQAIDQASVMEQPQPDPWQIQYDPYQQMVKQMDMQMPYMADPFAMPGPMMGPI